MYSIECKKCSKMTFYKTKGRYEKALQYSLCLKCNHEKRLLSKLSKYEIEQYYTTMIRKCPKCEKEIHHSECGSYLFGLLNKKECLSCSITGEKNGFYGKNHSKKTKLLIKTNMKKNPGKGMTDKTIYGQWVKNYGEKIADQKMIDLKYKLSKNSSGKNNPMYGKPSPRGSGNGWSGWYKGWFFRSLLELSYMIQIIERFNLKWKSAETNEFKVSYKDYNGKIKNYFPDFVIAEKYVIECKPKKLISSDLVNRKAKSAIKQFKKIGLIYKITSISKLSNNHIKKLYQEGLIKFTKRYEEKMKNFNSYFIFTKQKRKVWCIN